MGGRGADRAPSRAITGSISTASTCVAPSESAMATSFPFPAPITSVVPGSRSRCAVDVEVEGLVDDEPVDRHHRLMGRPVHLDAATIRLPARRSRSRDSRETTCHWRRASRARTRPTTASRPIQRCDPGPCRRRQHDASRSPTPRPTAGLRRSDSPENVTIPATLPRMSIRYACNGSNRPNSRPTTSATIAIATTTPMNTSGSRIQSGSAGAPNSPMKRRPSADRPPCTVSRKTAPANPATASGAQRVGREAHRLEGSRPRSRGSWPAGRSS